MPLQQVASLRLSDQATVESSNHRRVFERLGVTAAGPGLPACSCFGGPVQPTASVDVLECEVPDASTFASEARTVVQVAAIDTVGSVASATNTPEELFLVCLELLCSRLLDLRLIIGNWIALRCFWMVLP